MKESLDVLNCQFGILQELVSKIKENDTNIDKFLMLYKDFSAEKHKTQKLYYQYISELDKQIYERKHNLKQILEPEKNKLIEQMNNNIKEYTNNSLVNILQTPNENIIYKLYNDFHITSEKGGWAYGSRSQFTIEFPSGNPPKLNFPKEGYSIITYNHCLELYNLYKKYLTIQNLLE